MNEQATKDKADVLVVDDTPANLRLLSRMLTDNGYKVRPVPNGKLALDAVAAAPPDIILLDVRMPEMDGFEVCKKLKEKEETVDIPVIFISALQEMEDKIHGFEAGGVDYITKPFQQEEVLIRLSTHLTIRNQKEKLKEQFDVLKELEAMRDTLSHMIVHDLNNTLQAIIGYAEMMLECMGTLRKEEMELYTQSIISNGRTTIEMIRAILDVGRMESGQMQLALSQFSLPEVVTEVHEEIKCLLEQRKLKIKLEVPGSLPVMQADREIIRRIIINILGNAIRYSPEQSTITVTADQVGEVFRIMISDQGSGIPAEYKERIFEKYGQVDAKKTGRKYSTGLGLAFCKMAVEAHDGRIGVSDKVSGGSTFWFEVPCRL